MKRESRTILALLRRFGEAWGRVALEKTRTVGLMQKQPPMLIAQPARMLIAMLVAGVWLGVVPSQRALGQTTHPTKPSDFAGWNSCVSAECHVQIKSSPIVHGPVDSDSCDACHELKSAQEHKFVVKRTKAELCTFCHEFSTESMPVVHKPVAEGECLGCHDPHGGRTRALSREATMTELCGRCHESVTRDRSFIHGPVMKDACDACHTPHASRFKNLTDLAGTDLCLACHTEFEPKIASATYRHEALKEGCDKCHDVHGSNVPMSLKKVAPELCLDCHEKTKEQLASAKVPHSIVTKDRACSACHSAHASNVARLMSDQPINVCLKCHDKDVKNTRGQTIVAVADIADPSRHVLHGELRDGRCSGCHDAHGGQRDLLLKHNYSKSFYQKFSSENYELCFTCHDVRLLEEQTTTSATRFRNGDVNLHYIHANRGDRDKNCRACHETHSAAGNHLIRTTLKYGIWQMPIRFSGTETGGTCRAGCHAQWDYDRENPRPRGRQRDRRDLPSIPEIAQSQKQELHQISWTTHDIAGQSILIPDGRRPSVLVLLSADQNGVEAASDSLTRALPATTDAQIVIILCGKNALDKARNAKSNWPLVADESRDASEALGIRGWPTALVLSSDGVEIARISGEPSVLSLKLPTYLEMAAGTIDPAEAKHRLTTRPADDDARLLSRRLRTAAAMLDEGKIDAAMLMLGDLLEKHPESVEVKLLIIRAMDVSGKAQEAMKLANTLPPGTLQEHQATLLRVKAMIAQGQYNPARRMLEELLVKRPEIAEAHHLLGTLYERERNWQKAVEEYRIASELKNR